MKRYCWRESRAKIIAIVKTKMQLVLAKINTLEMNEFTENECLPNLKLKLILNVRKFKETTHTQKYEKTHWHWLWKGFLYLRNGAAHKNRKRLVLLRWLKLCDSRKVHCLTSEFHVEFHLKNRYCTHRFAIRAIWVFRVVPSILRACFAPCFLFACLFEVHSKARLLLIYNLHPPLKYNCVCNFKNIR